MSVLLISAPCQIFVTATASKFLFILDLARLLRFSDLLNILRALHARTFGNVFLSGATFRRPVIQPRRRRFRLLSCAMWHEVFPNMLMTS